MSISWNSPEMWAMFSEDVGAMDYVRGLPTHLFNNDGTPKESEK